jgi:hypothetical protein
MSASAIGGGTATLRANPNCVGERSLPRILRARRQSRITETAADRINTENTLLRDFCRIEHG